MWKNYGSALNSYLSFMHMHNMLVEPTANTLSLYTVYMFHHIKPDSVDTYLSGICHQLEPYFPHIHEIRKSRLAHQTLEGCKHLQGTPTVRKQALMIADLNTVINCYNNPTHNELLFCIQLCVGFFALMHLGKLTWPDDTDLRDPQKLTKCNSVILDATSFHFFLPGHKADKFFEGNTIILHSNPFPCDPTTLFLSYIQSHDCLFPLSSPLWRKSDGTVTRTFFMQLLCGFFEKDVGGQSMRAGGATSLVENGVAPHIIQGIR
ncbi:putative retroelement protein [Tricholoma matsutake]|nr:putative retroelement protein [Tricholoma matsutake 945]